MKGSRGGKRGATLKNAILYDEIFAGDNGSGRQGEKTYNFQRTGALIPSEILQKVQGLKGVTAKTTEIVMDDDDAYIHVVLDHPDEPLRPAALKTWKSTVKNTTAAFFDNRRKSLVLIENRKRESAVVIIGVGTSIKMKLGSAPYFVTTWIQPGNAAEYYSDPKHHGMYTKIY